MNLIEQNLTAIREKLPEGVTLVAVSKTKPIEDLQEAYNAGQRDFGENKIQELIYKQPLLPSDVRWHMIGHVQTNKIKYIAPFIHLIHGIDREKVLVELNKRAELESRVIMGLLQIHIAQESEKFGFDPKDVENLIPHLNERYPHVQIKGLMGMATFTRDTHQIAIEFKGLADFFHRCIETHGMAWDTLSMGMSGDYELALKAGSTMIRVGSSIFGARSPH